MAKSKWESVQAKLHLIEKWARDGLREDQISKNLGISVTTLEAYKKSQTELMKSLKKGKETLITELENALIKKHSVMTIKRRKFIPRLNLVSR